MATLTILAASEAVASGDAERGRVVFNKCKSCHQVGPNAKNSVGPILNGIFGRRAGVVEGGKYSDDMIRTGRNGLHWNAENLDIYIENPRNLISKTRMLFSGIGDAQDRADVIAYLRVFSDRPSNIPEAAPTAEPSSHDPEVDPTILAIQGDPAYGEYLAGECTTCHQVSGADNGIPSIIGWPANVFVTAMHAYRSKTRPHPVMRMIAGQLNDEEIASLAEYFKNLGE